MHQEVIINVWSLVFHDIVSLDLSFQKFSLAFEITRVSDIEASKSTSIILGQLLFGCISHLVIIRIINIEIYSTGHDRLGVSIVAAFS